MLDTCETAVGQRVRRLFSRFPVDTLNIGRRDIQACRSAIIQHEGAESKAGSFACAIYSYLEMMPSRSPRQLRQVDVPI